MLEGSLNEGRRKYNDLTRWQMNHMPHENMSAFYQKRSECLDIFYVKDGHQIEMFTFERCSDT